jgi:conjugative relaxase-like TrwC/TraI family protein
LGLSGEVAPDQLTAMLTGNNPATGEPLGLRAVPGRGPVPGFDLTFSAPKSVSLLWGIGGADVAKEVAAAHQRSVEAALTYMQRHACWTRRGAGGSEFVQGNGYLAAAYRHRSSRNGDPQLHTHVLIANVTRGPDGKWTRLYHPAIYDHAKTAGYLYEANLRHELSRSLGVQWQEVRKGIAEVEGFRDEWLREFSTRRAEILEAAGADASLRARQVANLTTRQAKERDVAPETMRERWLSRAAEIGMDREAIEATFNVEAQFATELTLDQLDRQVTAHASHFDRRDVVQAVAELLPNGAPVPEVESVADAFLASDSVVTVSETAKATRYTTQRIWDLEREALKAAERMAAEPRAEAGELIAARVIERRPTLKPDQREMVHRLLAGREGIVVVIGEAGTGKSFATVAAAEGWAQAGYSLRVAAPTWRAANVLRAEGLEATSIARLLGDIDRGKAWLSERSVLLIDEAGMVGSEDMAALIGHADTAGAKLVLIGDPQQLGAIDAGGLFSAIADRTDPVVLDEVIRHNHELDREAAKRIREGDGSDALSLYRSAERVTIAEDAEQRREAMVEDWWRSFREGEDALMISQRNAEVERLNAIAREGMRTGGRLGKEEIEVGEAKFAAGDQVITRVNDHAADIYNRERWEIAQVDAEKGRVVLEGIDQARRVEVGPDYLAQTTLGGDVTALQHAYAVTTYCAQGTTVDRAYVMADPSMDKRSSTSPPHAAARRPGSTPLPRSSPGEASTRPSERSPIRFPTSAKRLSATGRRPQPMTRCCGQSCRSCPAQRSLRGTTSLPARLARRPRRKGTTRVSKGKSRLAEATTRRPSPAAKPPKDLADASAARSCPMRNRMRTYFGCNCARTSPNWSVWSRQGPWPGGSAKSPIRSSPSEPSRLCLPLASHPRTTSSRSWGRGPPIPPRRRPGIAA